MNIRKSEIQYKSYCSVCGAKEYDENHRLIFDKKMIVIDEEEWNGLKMFAIFDIGYPINRARAVFLSEEGYELLMKQGFTNVYCQEVGRIEKAGTGKTMPYREETEYPYWKPNEYVEQLKKRRLRKK
jgi:hypothetical protein